MREEEPRAHHCAGRDRGRGSPAAEVPAWAPITFVATPGAARRVLHVRECRLSVHRQGRARQRALGIGCFLGCRSRRWCWCRSRSDARPAAQLQRAGPSSHRPQASAPGKTLDAHERFCARDGPRMSRGCADRSPGRCQRKRRGGGWPMRRGCRRARCHRVAEELTPCAAGSPHARP